MTRAFFHSAYWYGQTGSGFKAGRSRVLKQRLAAAGKFLERFLVEFCQQNGDGLIELVETEELVVSEPGQDPAFNDLYAAFHLGLVFGFAHPGRDHNRAVMIGHVQIGGIDIRFVKAGFGNAGFQVVRNHNPGHATKIGKGTGVGGDPVGRL